MAVATSLDGRRFGFVSPPVAPFSAGEFVSVTEASGTVWIGLVDDVAVHGNGDIAGTGRLLGIVDDDTTLRTPPPSLFVDAAMDRPSAAAIELVYSAAGATLPVGTLVDSSDVAARIIPTKFNRHTFWCGQSGSGKTYALGVLLEQLLLRTALPMVIFDPNADFVRMTELRSDAGTDEHRALKERDIRVLRPNADGDGSLLVRFASFSIRSKAAILRLDPIADRDEYNALIHFDRDDDDEDGGIITRLRRSGDAVAQSLATRVENLRLVDWELWAYGKRDVNAVLDERPDATVLDLGGFAFPDEHLVVALSVLDDLWAKREARRPILIVIDEAHNLCSPDNDAPLYKAVRERLLQIAAEGRKFGLWLLLSTQRPSKIHPGILSQCDNLALMRMSSPLDLDDLARTFGFAPRAMLERAPQFRQGEALFAGGFVPAPTLLKVRDRLTREGGADVRVPLRETR